MAYAILRQGNIAQAKEMFETSIQQIQKADNLGCLVYALEGLASLFLIQEQPKRAACLFAWADTTREKVGDMRPPLEQADVDRDIAVILVKIGNAAFEEAYKAGQVMILDEIVALALEELKI
ncbi:MAG TPA: hypothetical protein VK206_02185 [Anaerolineales bacterium]|nr:hypothetical protein [Anaerolineales bacterium]